MTNSETSSDERPVELINQLADQEAKRIADAQAYVDAANAFWYAYGRAIAGERQSY